jgi:hypothetical protein
VPECCGDLDLLVKNTNKGVRYDLINKEQEGFNLLLFFISETKIVSYFS